MNVGFNDLLNVAVMLAPGLTPVAPFTGEVAVTLGPGVSGVTGFDAAEGALCPARFTAITLKVYSVPLVSPSTGADVASAETPVFVLTTSPLTSAWSWNCVILDAPLAAPGENVTVAMPSPAVAVPITGVLGEVA